MKKVLFACFCLPALLFGLDAELIDLEQRAQDFVLETRKIEIPDYPLAFNPGIVRWKGRLLLSFRIIPDRKNSYNAEIGLVFLDDDFNPTSTPQLLNLRDEFSIAPCRAEDARLISIGERLFIVYDDNIEIKPSKGGFRVFVSELHYDGEHFIPDPIECLCHFEGASPERREKAWIPFEYHGKLLLVYSVQPHLIFYPPLNGSGVCKTVARTQCEIQWQWGELRGGTPAQLIDGQYLSFFHSSIRMPTVHSQGKSIMHYFMGAYTFSSQPPFAITAVSPEPLIGQDFYSGPSFKHYWKPIRCIFPCGYFCENGIIWIVYGRDDHECWAVKIDKNKLLQSLVPIQ